MLQAPMTKKKTPAPHPRVLRQKEPRHPFLLYFPLPVWSRVAKNLRWGEITTFIIRAVTEKMDREFPEEK
jgi:hypothetical protein